MDAKVNENEIIKARSNFLRGTLKESMADELTGALDPADAQISKFHGFYEQDNRDLRQDRRERFLEPYYGFMLRARLPGGVCRPEQWLVIDEIGRTLLGSAHAAGQSGAQHETIIGLKEALAPVLAQITVVLLVEAMEFANLRIGRLERAGYLVRQALLQRATQKVAAPLDELVFVDFRVHQ